jgi:hypothetical protein
MAISNEALGISILVAGVAVLATYAAQHPLARIIQIRRNSDGSCTYFYDDGSEETGVCDSRSADG